MNENGHHGRGHRPGLVAVAAKAQQITGAGATFPAPVYTKWGEAAKAATGIELNYQAIGSGGGQNQILQPHGRFRRLRRADGPRQAGQSASCCSSPP